MLEIADLAGRPILVTDLLGDSSLQDAAVAEFVDRAERAGFVVRHSTGGRQGLSVLSSGQASRAAALRTASTIGSESLLSCSTANRITRRPGMVTSRAATSPTTKLATMSTG